MRPLRSPGRFSAALVLTASLSLAALAQNAPAPAGSTPAPLAAAARPAPTPLPPTGEHFADPAKPGVKRVLIIGGGSSHDFEKWFHQADEATIKSGGFDATYSANVDEAVALLSQADVLVFTTNQPFFGAAKFQSALQAFAETGKGIVIVHAGLWYNWPETTGYNAKFVGGGTRSHDKFGPFTVTVTAPEHPVVKGVPATFQVEDELYQAELSPMARCEVLASTSTSAKTGKMHPSVWIVPHASSRIVCLALGHDGKTHDSQPFKTLLLNAIAWSAGK